MCERGARVWSFQNDYAGILGLGARIENFHLADEKGAPVKFRQLAPGEFETADAATRFSYEVKLDAPLKPTDAPFVSWLTARHGILQLGDLLPRALQRRIEIKFALPDNWRVISAEPQTKDGSFNLADAESAVFLIAREANERETRAQKISVKLAMLGAWAFTETDVAQTIGEVVDAETKIFGSVPTKNSRAALFILPFPREDVPASLWSAATRGRTVVFCSGKLPSRVAALAQLQPALAHELFHLWIPNALALEGDYSWFYEGFTLYETARICVQLGYLNFQDLLASIARAFDAYKSAATQYNFSLPEAARRRWSGTEQLVYNKGMVVAFLCDLMLRWRSNDKRTLADIYRALLAQHNSAQPHVDGNAAIIKLLSDAGEMQDFVARYVLSSEPIDLATALAPFGLRAEWNGARTHIFIADNLGRRQRHILRGLGYESR